MASIVFPRGVAAPRFPPFNIGQRSAATLRLPAAKMNGDRFKVWNIPTCIAARRELHLHIHTTKHWIQPHICAHTPTNIGGIRARGEVWLSPTLLHPQATAGYSVSCIHRDRKVKVCQRARAREHVPWALIANTLPSFLQPSSKGKSWRRFQPQGSNPISARCWRSSSDGYMLASSLPLHPTQVRLNWLRVTSILIFTHWPLKATLLR